MSDKKLYILKNLEKKNVWNTEYWSDERGRRFGIEEMFRWGETILELDEDEVSEIQTYIFEETPIQVGDYSIYDNGMMDCCAHDFFQCNNLDNQDDVITVDQVQEMWDNDQYSAFEEAGFEVDEIDLVYHGLCELTEYKSEN